MLSIDKGDGNLLDFEAQKMCIRDSLGVDDIHTCGLLFLRVARLVAKDFHAFIIYRALESGTLALLESLDRFLAPKPIDAGEGDGCELAIVI